jgi:uncharacterized protein YfaS (alpha-2-macroglobulin family)
MNSPRRRSLSPDGEIDQRIKDTIPRLLARQDSNGSIGLWSVGGDDPWLDAYVTDFLTRARERGFRDRQSAAGVVGRDGLAWIADAVEPVNTEFRDDRFTAAFDRKQDSTPVFSVAYVVRAVLPGRYVLPQAKVEDMYRPDRFGRTATGAIEISPK